MNPLRFRLHTLVLAVCTVGFLLFGSAAQAEQSFADWLAGFRQDALKQGISPATLDAVLTDMEPVARAIELDRSQPEFVRTFSSYLAKRVTPERIARGQTLLSEHAALFDEVEARYGVPRAVLAAFWGLETNFGATKGSYSIPAVLATLAYEGRRHDFFRAQLMDAMRILDAGHVPPADMLGSWAGAMGHMQFMPSTFLAYAVDGDGDRRIDLWQSLPDAMHSAAHYLQTMGWQQDAPIALEVQLPPGFDWQQAQFGHRKPVADWAAMDVTAVGGEALPVAAGEASIVLPQGWRGPALMVFDNFDAIMRWNRSVNYALSVALLAQRLAGGADWSGGIDAEQEALSSDEMKRLQQQLTQLGFDAGPADGLSGKLTQTAIRGYQQAHGLPMDGYASPSLLRHIECCAGSAPVEGPAD